MTEATSVVGLVESVASLIDFSAEVTSHILEFTSKTSDLPESFSVLLRRLPLLTSSLQSISSQAQTGGLPNDVTKALEAVINSTLKQVLVLQTCFSTVTPLINTSRAQRAADALKSLAKEQDIKVAVEKISEDIDFLVLHQNTRQVDVGERDLDELTKLQLAPALSPVAQYGHDFPNVSTHGQSKVHLGDVYHVNYHEPDEVRSLGQCFGSAPLIDTDQFIGRAAEIDRIRNSLRPDEASVEQRRVVLGGMGGIGKTQLAIAYARRHRRCYTSVLWLNATSEVTLYASVRSVAHGFIKAEELEKLDNKQVLARTHEWLSRPGNTQWLLIFDNYDDPDQLNVENFCPNTGYGSIIITTRLPDQVKGQQVRVLPLKDIDESLDILQARSRRENVKNNEGARRLVERLAGLPLALATAGAYLHKNTITFQQYLEAYEKRWKIDPRRAPQLQEYQDRTLYTTWNLSFIRLETEDPDAAHMLKLLAYFDNQEIWYELLDAGVDEDSPVSLRESVTDQIGFESVMRTLVDYCLVEVQSTTQSYSMHSCVHDWTLGELNRVVDPQLYWYAFDCVVGSIYTNNSPVALKLLRYGGVSRHAVRLTHYRFQQDIELDTSLSQHFDQLVQIAQLLADQVKLLTDQAQLRADQARLQADEVQLLATLSR